MNSIDVLDIISVEGVNHYLVKNLNTDATYKLINYGDCLDLKGLYDYLNYCYDNYFINVKGYKDFLLFENEECNVYSLNKYKIYNYVGLYASKLLK